MDDNNHVINNKLALSSLKDFRRKGYMNLVAINPLTGLVTGITRDLAHPDIERFIEDHNGKSNLYFMVNEPYPTAPDTKLKKEHVHKIHGVWLDADPHKDELFELERIRLQTFADGLVVFGYQPTYIIDSGGGIQAFWLYNEPVDATPETIAHNEALSRGLAQCYGTDAVHNIDRIMRIPYTMNIPTEKKKALGRTPALATMIHTSHSRYDDMHFISPVNVSEVEKDYENIELDMTQVRAPVPAALEKKFKHLMGGNLKIQRLMADTIEKTSRSEKDFALTKELKWNNFTIEEISNIVYHYKHGKGAENDKRSLIRNFVNVENPFTGLDQADIDRIANQTNPILEAKKEAKKEAKRMIENNSALITLDKVNFRDNAKPLVRGLIDRNTTNLFYGPSGEGKTFAMIDMALAIAKGDASWDQYRIPEQMGVLMVVGEGGGGYNKRVEVARRKHQIENLHPKNVPFGFITGYFNLHDSDETAVQTRKIIVDRARELEDVSGIKTGLFIYDTMSMMLGKGDENVAKDVRTFRQHVEEIATVCDLASLIMHHTGKDEAAGARGSIALKGDMNSQIKLSVKEVGGRKTHYISSPKQREHADSIVTKFKLNIMELGKDEYGDPIDSCFIVLESEETAHLFPSVIDELNSNAKIALDVIKFYETVPNSDITPLLKPQGKFTEKQIKVIIYNDVIHNNGIFDLKSSTNTLVECFIMAIPNKSITQSFDRACEDLSSKNITRKDKRYQLLN